MAKWHAPEGSDGEARRRLHLDGKATLGHAASDLAARFAVQPVGGPGLAGHVRHLVSCQSGHDRGHGVGIRGDLSGGRQVVVARPFVADGGRRNDDVPELQLRNECAGAARGNECPAAQGDELLDEGRGEWRPDAGMNDGEPAVLVRDLIDRVFPDLGAEAHDLAACVFADDALDDVLEVAQHDVRGDVARIDQGARLDHRLGRIELQDRGQPRTLRGFVHRLAPLGLVNAVSARSR